MKKSMIILITLVLAMVLSLSSAQASPEEQKGQFFSDFSVDTINGTIFSLSESLKSHELVLINFWATWCGPCRMEFPYLETAWEQYADRVDVIALSVDKTETLEDLNDFADAFNLNFQIGRDVPGLFDGMEGIAIPTTLIVDQSRCVVAVEMGAKKSVEDFTSLFDSLLNASQDKTYDEAEVLEQITDTEDGTWICSNCNAKNSDTDALCTNCAQPRQTPLETIDTEDGTWICSNCNTKNSDTDAFCINCARPRHTSAETTDTEDDTWICSVCNTKNSIDDFYCINCGQSRRCPNCGRSVPVTDRYCQACGEEVKGWRKQDSRKLPEAEDSCYCNCNSWQDSAVSAEYPNNFIKAMNALSGGSMSYAEVGDRLVFTVDYAQFQKININDFMSLDPYQEELSRYSSVIILMMKDGKVYRVDELSLAGAKTSDKTPNTLMSMEYLSDAAKTGR